MAPAAFQAAVLAWLGVVTLLLAAFATQAPKWAQSVKDIQAAFGFIHKHDKQLDGEFTPRVQQIVKDQVAGGLAAAPASSAPRPLPAPLWTQQNDPNPDGSQDPYWYEDCGEESVSIVAKSCRGVEVPEGSIRVQMHGVGGRGLSSGDDLVNVLTRWDFAAKRHDLPAATALTYISQAVKQRRPIIALGRWIDPAYLHWVVIVLDGPESITYVDPWFGQLRKVDLAEWETRYAGTLVDPGEVARYSA